ncbi:SIR2 family protein [Sphingobacterium psychroaquaticum]|uniref:Uncharacterized protein n=1 Tax=Sphingobacterium psychroaquaticum TaxID=561061 RepID=A0A1X7IDW3_9SPHI|nr:hypothetical protein [Sphingobacterium psychroaquaticum]SMG12862.1 hypothetical protein SAMN05660862_0726 [Sphingobacterium psychroaquaticum]
MTKTTFILGAGFSCEAGAPSQEKIVEKIFEIYNTVPHEFEENSFHNFREFLSNTLNIPESLQTQVPLEDLFTPIDRAILDNISFRDLSTRELKKIRRTIYYLISKTLQVTLKTSNKKYIDKFAEYIVSQCSPRANRAYRGHDRVSILSTNWDILLDNSIKRILDKDHQEPKGVVDYCCYISSYKEDDDTIKPGLEILGSGGFNVKLLKLHGSLNWLQCPRCQRLYVDFYRKISIDHYSNCRHCDKNFGKKRSHSLTSNLIMPTFLKDLSNPQYKLIWQNAGIELSESNNIIFIGYSLPSADFEMRQLLSRMIRDDAKITVVDYGDESLENIKNMKLRYETFFGNRQIEFYLKGTKSFIENEYP